MYRKVASKLNKSSVFWQSLANYFERGWALLYSILLARLISPEQFGIFAFGTSIAVLAALISKWEIGNLIRVDEYFQGKGFGLAWKMTGLLVWVEIIIVTIVVSICAVMGVPELVCWVAGITGLVTAIDKFSHVLRGDLESKGQFKTNFTVKLIYTPICAIITITLALFDHGVFALLGGVLIGALINWIVFRKANPREVEVKELKISDLKRIIKPSFWQWTCSSSNALFLRADKLFVGIVAASSTLGFYNRAYNFAPLSFMIFGAMAGSPAIHAFKTAVSESKQLAIYINRLAILVGSGILSGILWLCFAEPIVLFLYGSNWIGAIPYLKSFAFFGVVQGFYYLTYSFLQSKKMYIKQAIINWVWITIFLIGGCFYITTAIEIAFTIQILMIVCGVTMLIVSKTEGPKCP